MCHRAVVRGHVRAAKAIDRLLGIPHDEELAGRQSRVEGAGGGRPGRILGQEENDLVLQGVGVLELVYQQEPQALRDPPPYVGMVG